MAARTSSASTLPWIWVIEALANFKEVDISILIDLVNNTPEISDDLGKNTREMVSLRISESFVSQPVESTEDVSSALDSKVEFGPSEHCEDVVRYILHEISASNLRKSGPEVLKWDFQTLVRHKRACLRKCTLQQLNHAILEGNYPTLESLKERSGLLNNRSENKIPAVEGDLNAVVRRFEGCFNGGQTTEAGGNSISATPENSDDLLQEYSPERNLLPSKRDRSDLDAEKQAAKSHKDHITVHNGCSFHLHDTKKLQQGSSFTGQPVGQKAVPITLNELSEFFFGSNEEHTVREASGLAKVSQKGYLEESRFHDQHIASKRNGAVYTGLQQNNPQASCNNNIETQDTSGDGPHRDLPVHEANVDDERCGEMGTSDSVPPDGTYLNICGNEAGDLCEKSQLNGFYKSNFPDESKDGMDHNPGQETPSDSDGYEDENIDIAMKRHTFLSSPCTFSRDDLGTPDCTELNLCMKCNKGCWFVVQVPAR